MKKFFNIGIIGVMLIMGLAFIGCDNGSTDNGGGGGGSGLTVSGLASYTGKNAYVAGNTAEGGYITSGSVPITGDSVVFSMYSSESGSPKKYTGSDTFDIGIIIGENELQRNFFGVKFTNGNASVNWADGQDQ